MRVDEYFELMSFSPDWKTLDMLPPSDFVQVLIDTYEPGMENASEHDRNGCFHYWLQRELTEIQLTNLKHLAKHDPDKALCSDILQRLQNLESKG